MASYTGILVDMPDRLEESLRCSASIVAMEVTNPDLYTVTIADPIAESTHTNNLPIEMNEVALTGRKVDSHLDDYYYRVHINPASFALGAVLSVIEEEFIVWNAWFVQNSCSAINEVSGDEFDLTGLTAPFALSGLGWATYTLSIPEDGSLEFTASATWVFSTESVTLEISGLRVAIFPHTPLLPLQERLDWNTNVIRSKDGSEQRMSIRPVPRQGFKIQVYFQSEQEQARFDALLFNWQKRAWAIPVWSDWVQHTAAINADDTTITFDTSNGDFRDESNAIIWQSPTSYEAVRILSVADSSGIVTLDRPVQNNWTGLKWILPLRTGYMTGVVKRPAAPDGYGYAACEFIVKENKLQTGFTAVDTYNGLTVVTESSLVDTGEQEVTSQGDIHFTDYGVADFAMHSDSDFNIVTVQHVFRRTTKADCWDFREFLHSLYGRRNPVWLISDRDDLNQLYTIGAAETDFRVSNLKLADNMGATNTMRTHLAFMFPDGTKIYRQVTGIVEDSDTEEIISINSALGVQVEPGDCEICWLDKCRLAEDLVEIEWQEHDLLVSRINFVRVIA